jgi:methionine biosynthesis protein MetW
MRSDLKLIQQWVDNDQRVLDLGCGEGELLDHLTQHKNVEGVGLERDPKQITKCIAKGLNVVHRDLNKGIAHISDQSFDLVIMTQALQVVDRPDELLNEMVRVAKTAIVTFPNFGHWSTRFYLGFKGKMPMSETLPHRWFNTPNIHLCTFIDFEELCRNNGITIKRRTVVDSRHQSNWKLKILPNVFGEFAVYEVSK